jgi:flavin-dependent dehydrogenase
MLDFGAEKPFTIPRQVLDQSLLDSALAAGVRLELGVTVVGLERRKEGFRVQTRDGRVFSADFLVGADGRNSWVARQLGLARSRKHSLQHAAVMGHFILPSGGSGLSGVEMHVTPWGYVGLNPLPGNWVNVIAVLSPKNLKKRLSGKGNAGLISLLTEHVQGSFASPSLQARMQGAQVASDQVWTVSPIAWIPQKIVGDRCALVGDSAGFIDPFTGEGLYHALVSAHEIGVQIEKLGLEQGLEHYARWHSQVFGPEERFCLWLQKLLPFSAVADYAIGQLGKKPKLKHILAETVADRLPIEKVLSPVFWGKVLWPSIQTRGVE